MERLNESLADRYSIAHELGRGGMATVYLATDLRHARSVALKLLHPQLAALLGSERFLREVALMASLQHPNILPLFDSGEAGDSLFYVMPFVAGATLRARLQQERQLPVAEAVRIAAGVADALTYAHARGVIHRDIKPENILLDGERALLADFGIALSLRQATEARLTETGVTVGTPQYMAPEQATGEGTLDGRADIYALGAVTYEMLAGEPPFTGSSIPIVITRLLTENALPLGRIRAAVPTHVESAVHVALQKLPADRHHDASAFAALLRAAPMASSTSHPPSTLSTAEGRGSMERHDALGEQSVREASRRRWRLVGAGAAVTLVAAAIGWPMLGVTGASGPTAPDALAVALYQRGMHAYSRRTPHALAEAVLLLDSATRRAPEMAAAWRGLARSYVRAYERGFEVSGVPRDSMVLLAAFTADRAYLIDSVTTEALVVQALVSRGWTLPTSAPPSVC